MVELVFIAFTVGTVLLLLSNEGKGFYSLIVLAVVLCGLVQYFFPSIGALKWGGSLTGVFLFLIYPFKHRSAGKKIPAFFIFLVLFPVYCLIVSLLNDNMTDFLYSAKNTFQFWTIPFLVFFVPDIHNRLESYAKFIILLAFVQIPLSIAQYLWFSKSLAPGDSVSGTLGGLMESGGPNAFLSIYMLAVIYYVLSRFRSGELNFIKMILSCGLLLLPIALTHAKIVIVLFFVVLWFMSRMVKKGEGKRSAIVVAMISLLGVAVVGAYVANYHLFSKKKSNYDLETAFETTIKYNTSSSYENNLSRLGTFTYWYDENKDDALALLFGHGLGATKNSGLHVGSVAGKFKYRDIEIGGNLLASMLWDVGAVGVIMFLLIFLLPIKSCMKKCKNSGVGDLHIYEFTTIFLLMVVLSFPHNLSVVSEVACSFMTFFLLGVVAACPDSPQSSAEFSAA